MPPPSWGWILTLCASRPATPASWTRLALTAAPPGEVEAERPDLLVVNPPRRGIGEQLSTRIEASGVERVLYSSCNPRTLATDLAHLPSMRVVRARLFDMFPHTDHAEVLVELVRS